MILVDTGPLVALFDPRDGQHERGRPALKTLRDPLITTVPACGSHAAQRCWASATAKTTR